MPILYKVITAVLAVTGCISLLLTGELNPLMTVSGLAILPGYYRFIKGMGPAPNWAVGALSLFTLIVFLTDSFLISGDVFLAVAQLTITFQALKSFDLKEPWDHLQVYFMSLLQLIIASDLTRSLTFGVVFVVFMGLLVTAMVLSHFLKEGALGRISIRKPVLLISLFTLLLTVMIFILIPRTSQRFLVKSHAKGIKTTGFSEKVDFGSIGDIKLDPTVVMRVEMDRDVPLLYWRGLALDYFDGRSWRNTREGKNRAIRDDDEFRIEQCDKNRTIEQRIFLEPIDSDIIFGLPKVCTVKSEGFSLSSDFGKGMYLRGKSSRRVKYSIYSLVGDSYEGVRDERYLQLSKGVERIASLAKEITSGSAPAKQTEQKAALILKYLKNNYTYSLSTSSPPAGVSPIEDFIFNTKKGYCEHYATSMALMLRSLDIPSRIVTGYFGGEKNEYGGYIIVRQSNAHSWVEALIDDRWKTFDPTPADPVPHPSIAALFLDSLQLNWSRYVVGFSSTDQRDIIRGLSMPFRLRRPSGLTLPDLKMLIYSLAAAAFFFLIIFLAFHKMRTRKYGFITERYLALRKLISKKKGIRMKESMTSGDIKRSTIPLGIAEDLEEFLRMYEEHRFGLKEMGPEDRRRYEMLLKEMKKKI
jgi:transglutaminase-like putative cysteine protease